MVCSRNREESKHEVEVEEHLLLQDKLLLLEHVLKHVITASEMFSLC